VPASTKLVDKRMQAGEDDVSFDARRVVSGVNFYRLQTDRQVETRKITLLK
jgi:hypothetical protein